jgi:hypothetical protein
MTERSGHPENSFGGSLYATMHDDLTVGVCSDPQLCRGCGDGESSVRLIAFPAYCGFTTAFMETSLYQPVKTFLESAGYEVKGEIGGCDLVGLSPSDPPVTVICELKLSFNLELILQAVDRAAIADEVWIAARISAKGKGREADRRYRDLCRRLGFGMLGVSDLGEVSIIVNSVSPMPRTNPKRRSRLVREHRRRRGDPTSGGSTRIPIMTAYRQQALICAELLVQGPLRPKDIKPHAPDAGKILLANFYGWFERVDKGVYQLTEAGHQAVARQREIQQAAE